MDTNTKPHASDPIAEALDRAEREIHRTRIGCPTYCQRWVCDCDSVDKEICQTWQDCQQITTARAEHVRNKAELAALRAALEALLEADTAICENIGTKSNQAMQRIAALDTARAELNP